MLLSYRVPLLLIILLFGENCIFKIVQFLFLYIFGILEDTYLEIIYLLK